MLCPHCQAGCPEDARFCTICGARLPDAAAAAPPEQEAPVSREPLPAIPEIPKKGTHWVPSLILLGMFLLGLLLFWITENPPIHLEATEVPWFQMDDNGAVYFRENAYTGDGTVTVPETLNGRTVRALGEGCFAGSTIQTALLPDTLRVIGEDAFAGCASLRGIFLPQGVAVIGEGAFAACGSLEAICIPGTVHAIGSNAFGSCNSMRFVFYSGYFKGWETLYGDFITPFTRIICVDGTFSQDSAAP